MTIRFRTGLALACLAGFPALLSACDSFFFRPHAAYVPNPYLERFKRDDVFFRTPDGVRLHGWLLRPGIPPRGTILYFHGNAGDIRAHAGEVLWLAQAGYQVFLVDYRGYGESAGKPDIAGVHVDALAAIDRTFRMDRVDPERVAVFGQSLGGAIAVYAVANSVHRDRIRALIIDSAFSGYRRIARHTLAKTVVLWPLQYPLSLLVTDRYSPSRWIGRLRPIPVLILHGTADPVVPVEHARDLYRLAGEPKDLEIVPGAGHIAALAENQARERFLSFLDDAFAAAAPGASLRQGIVSRARDAKALKLFPGDRH